jgi:hypothetical protein
VRTDDYKNAIVLAAKELSQKDPKALSEASGSQWDGQNYGLSFLNRDIVVHGDFTLAYAEPKEGEEIPLTDAVLILHYLLGAKGLGPGGEFLAYRQFPGGEFYTQAFHKRAEIPLTKTFGATPGLLTKAALKLNGTPQKGFGDESAVFRVLPHLDILTLIHYSDDEFEADGQVLFDKTIGQYLHIEDISWLGSTLVYRLMGLARS